MTAGKLAAAKPAATTDTRLYQCPIGRTASVVLNVCNQDSNAATYRVAVKNYTQVITLSSSAHTFNLGNPVSAYKLTISPGISISEFDPGDQYEDDLGKWKLNILDVFRDTSTITVPTKVTQVGTISYGTISPALTDFSVGNTLTDATSSLTAKVLGLSQTPGTAYIELSPVSTAATTLKTYSVPTALIANKYLAIPNAQPATSYEIVQVTVVTSATNTLTITRSQQGTTAAVINPGSNATILDITATTKTINEGATFTATDTTLTLNNVTNLFTGDYLKIDNEFLLVQNVDTGTSSVTVQRAQLSSTAATHADGATVTRVANDGTVYVNYFAQTPVPAAATKTYAVSNNLTSDYVFTGDATGNDPTLTVNIGDTLTFNLNAAGHPMHITNQNGAYNVANEVTTGVTGAGTAVGTLTWNTAGFAAGTYYYVCEFHATMIGQIVLQTPDTSPTIGNGTTTARLTTMPNAFQYATEFVHDFNSDGNYEWTAQGFSMNLGRIYRFTQVDTSNTGHPFRFSDQTGFSPVYTTGVTTSGTPGSSGAYTQIDLTASSPTVLYSFSTGTGEGTYGSTITIDSDPSYNVIYVYDVTATPTVTDTFAVGATTPTTQTVTAVSAGAYGYVQEFSGTELKVSLGPKSTDFAATNTFYDTPLIPGGTRTTATVSSVAEVKAEDYILYGKSLSANTTDKNSGIVLGSGQSLLVYSSSANLSFVVNGFEDVTNDWTTVHYDQGGNQGGNP
jgi:plastocyanin